MTKTTEIAKLPCVAKVAAWNDRYYVTLANVSRSAKGDNATKIWLKGDVLTIEAGKGYNSDAWIADKYALVDAAKALGVTVREV